MGANRDSGVIITEQLKTMPDAPKIENTDRDLELFTEYKVEKARPMRVKFEITDLRETLPGGTTI